MLAEGLSGEFMGLSENELAYLQSLLAATEPGPDLQTLHERLYAVLYAGRDCVPCQSPGRNVRSRFVSLLRKAWYRVGGAFFRSLRDYHANLANIIYLQNRMIEELGKRIDSLESKSNAC